MSDETNVRITAITPLSDYNIHYILPHLHYVCQAFSGYGTFILNMDILSENMPFLSHENIHNLKNDYISKKELHLTNHSIIIGIV